MPLHKTPQTQLAVPTTHRLPTPPYTPPLDFWDLLRVAGGVRVLLRDGVAVGVAATVVAASDVRDAGTRGSCGAEPPRGGCRGGSTTPR